MVLVSRLALVYLTLEFIMHLSIIEVRQRIKVIVNRTRILITTNITVILRQVVGVVDVFCADFVKVLVLSCVSLGLGF